MACHQHKTPSVDASSCSILICTCVITFTSTWACWLCIPETQTATKQLPLEDSSMSSWQLQIIQQQGLRLEPTAASLAPIYIRCQALAQHHNHFQHSEHDLLPHDIANTAGHSQVSCRCRPAVTGLSKAMTSAVMQGLMLAHSGPQVTARLHTKGRPRRNTSRARKQPRLLQFQAVSLKSLL